MKFAFLHQHLLSSVIFFHFDLSVITCSYDQLLTTFLNAKYRMIQTISINFISTALPKSTFQKHQYLQPEKHFYFGFLDYTYLSKKRRKALLLTVIARSEALKKAWFCISNKAHPLYYFLAVLSVFIFLHLRDFFQWKHKTQVYVMQLSHT